MLKLPGLWIFTSRSMRPPDPVGPIPFERVTRFTCADLAAAGLADAILAWVGAVVESGLRALSVSDRVPELRQVPVRRVRLRRAMLAGKVCSQRDARRRRFDSQCLFRAALQQWHWMPYQRDVYAREEVRLALLNVCFILAAPALKMLHQRRLAMKNDDPSVRSWPSSEVFVASEVVRAGMNVVIAGRVRRRFAL